MFPGDTYVTNDPWKGTGHLHDITMVSPSFKGDVLVGFFACTAHVVDVGGRGFGADGKSVYEEGIQVPIMKFAERGVVNQFLVQMLRANVREASITLHGRPAPGAISGRHFRQGRNAAASACAGVSKKRQLRRCGVRTRQIGRQYTPVLVTPTNRRPSKRASRAARAW